MGNVIEYCICKKPPGYCSLQDSLNTFVCGSCYLPSWGVYVTSEKECEECGGTFFSPWQDYCLACHKALCALVGQVQADIRRGLATTGDLESAWLALTVDYRTWLTERDRKTDKMARADYSVERGVSSKTCPACKRLISDHDRDQAATCHGTLANRRQSATKKSL